MTEKFYSTARILVGTGDVKHYDIGTQPNFIQAVRAANQVVDQLQQATNFVVRLVEVK